MIPGTAIAAGSWLVGYVVTAWLAAGTSGASAYAVLCGWWLTAYMSARARIPVLSVGPLYIAYLAVFVGVYLTGSSALYREAPTLGLISAIAVGAAQALVVISPILFDGIWRRVTGAA